ncbi:MAG: vitamin K epoxide reductase family protein [Candidatus Eisenbacteria bacterium]
MIAEFPAAHATGGPWPARHAARSPLVWAAVLALAGMAETATLAIGLTRYGSVPCTRIARSVCTALFAAHGTGPLGVPLPLWGMTAYALAFVLALASLTSVRPPVRVALGALTTAMALASAALMLRMVKLGALCPWCMASAALSFALAALALRQSAGTRRLALAAGGALGAVWLVALVVAPLDGTRVRPEDAGYARQLAEHLRASGARFYGLWWCSGCRDQKARFGDAASALPYVECSVEPVPDGVREFPTWEIAGERLVGVQSFATLAARSRFVAPSAATAAR